MWPVLDPPMMNSVDGFIFVGINFRGLNKKYTWGSIRGHCIFSLMHTENNHFVGTGIRGSDPPRKLVPHEI